MCTYLFILTFIELCFVFFCSQHCFVSGQRKPPQRHVIESEIKESIFGSHAYNPLKDIFEPMFEKSKPSIDTTTELKSTALGEIEKTSVAPALRVFATRKNAIM